jgi:hypothetical protein
MRIAVFNRFRLFIVEPRALVLEIARREFFDGWTDREFFVVGFKNAKRQVFPPVFPV